MSNVIRTELAIPRRLATLIDHEVELEWARTGDKVSRQEMMEAILWRSFAGKETK